MVLGIGIAAPEGVLLVAQEEGLEFQRDRQAHRIGQHEVHEALAEADLPCRVNPQHIVAQLGEEVFGGGFGFRAVFQVQRVFVDGRVIGNRF